MPHNGTDRDRETQTGTKTHRHTWPTSILNWPFGRFVFKCPVCFEEKQKKKRYTHTDTDIYTCMRNYTRTCTHIYTHFRHYTHIYTDIQTRTYSISTSCTANTHTSMHARTRTRTKLCARRSSRRLISAIQGRERWMQRTEQTARPKKSPDTQKIKLKQKTSAPNSKNPEKSS